MVSALLLMFCVSIQLSRKDKNFVRLHVSDWYVQMYLEYVFLTLPFATSALFTAQYYHFPLLLLILYVVPRLQLNRDKVTLLPNLSKLMHPANSVEWIAGIRTSVYSLLPMYLVALFGAPIRILPLLLLWLITATIMNFYHEFEDLQTLKAKHLHATQFLNHKIKVHSQRLALLCSPILIINAAFNPSFIDINILFLMNQITLLVFAISMKYSSYVPSTKNSAANIIVSLITISAVVPYLLPLPLIFAIIYYKKAIQNLKHYFHD
jgi:hypothetical protein